MQCKKKNKTRGSLLRICGMRIYKQTLFANSVLVIVIAGASNLVKIEWAKPKFWTKRKTEFRNFVDFFYPVALTLFCF